MMTEHGEKIPDFCVVTQALQMPLREKLQKEHV